MTNNDFNIVNPLTFEIYDFYNENDRNLLYIDDDPRSIKLNLEITNNTGRIIKLNASEEESEPSPNNFHLELQFRPGEISELSAKQVDLGENSKRNWSISRPAEERDGFVYLYLLRKSKPLVIPEKDEKGSKGKETITLKGIAANASGGVRGTNLNIRYRDFYFESDRVIIEDSFLVGLTILGRRGLRKSPLAITFVLKDSILNDSSPQNFLVQIKNTSKESIVFGKESKFIITIDVVSDSDIDPRHSALVKKDDVKDIKILPLKINDWHIAYNDQAENPEWTLTPNFENNPNPSLETLKSQYFVLDNIKTKLDMGQGNIYIFYTGLPGYTSDRVILGLKKTCLIERDKKVGIGKYPQSELDVDGVITAASFVGKGAEIDGTVTAKSFSGIGAAVTGMIMMWYGDKEQIPEGWALCDGSNGTPDLRDRFIMGAGSESSGRCGDADQHTHTVQIPQQDFYTEYEGSHSHDMSETWKIEKSAIKDVSLGIVERFWAIDPADDRIKESKLSGNHHHKVPISYSPFDTTSYKGQNRPRWCALYFIIKVTTINAPPENFVDFSRNTEWRTASGYRLVFQDDGNFALYSKGLSSNDTPDSTRLWATGTISNWGTITTDNSATGTIVTLLRLTSDGNLALLDDKNKPVWDTKTSGNSGAYLVFHEDGNLVLYSKDKQILFQTNTANGKRQTTNAVSTWQPKQ